MKEEKEREKDRERKETAVALRQLAWQLLLLKRPQYTVFNYSEVGSAVCISPQSFASNVHSYWLSFSHLAMAPHSSTLAWKIPWTEEPGRLQSMGSLRVRHDWATSLSLFTFIHWRRKWQPTPVFLPGESHGQRSLVNYSPQDHRESDMTERLTHRHKAKQFNKLL